MCSFKHTIVLNVGRDCVKLREVKKETISLKQVMTNNSHKFCFCYRGAQFTGCPAAKPVNSGILTM